MIVQRYVFVVSPYGCDHCDILSDLDGDYVRFEDYAALDARCAGLERERDELQSSFKLSYKADMRGIESWQKATGKTLEWPDRARLVEWMMNERDALQSKLAAAEEALRKITRYHPGATYDMDDYVYDLKDIARAALAGTTNKPQGE